MSPKNTEKEASSRLKPISSAEIRAHIKKSQVQLRDLEAFAKGIDESGKPLLIDGKLKMDRAWSLIEQVLSNLRTAKSGTGKPTCGMKVFSRARTASAVVAFSDSSP